MKYNFRGLDFVNVGNTEFTVVPSPRIFCYMVIFTTDKLCQNCFLCWGYPEVLWQKLFNREILLWQILGKKGNIIDQYISYL
jgi:hypothetical protein